MKQITQTQFSEEVASGQSFVMFGGVGCGNCKMQETLLPQVISEFPNVNFLKIDAQGSPDLVAQYGVSTLPTMLVVRDGEVLESLVGLKPKPVLVKKLAELFN